MTESIQVVMQKLKRASSTPQLIEDWKRNIPATSRWSPGDPGSPFCEKCEGTGYITLSVPVNHPYFGKILFCDCVSTQKILEHEQHLSEKGKR